MNKKKTRQSYEEYLNDYTTPEIALEMTEHCWAGNDKTQKQKNWAKKMAKQGKVGTILRKLDPIAFQVGFNDWVR